MKLILLLLIPFSFTITSCNPHFFYVVRHAEKAAAPASGAGMASTDPPLSEAGKVRAIVLRDELKQQHIAYIFSTNTIRTIATAKPLSEETGIAIQLYNTRDSLDFFISNLKAIKKKNVLIVGHSNTVADIVNKLCNETKITGDLQDTEYDNLFIIKRNGRKTKFIRKKYGYPSNP